MSHPIVASKYFMFKNEETRCNGSIGMPEDNVKTIFLQHQLFINRILGMIEPD